MESLSVAPLLLQDKIHPEIIITSDKIMMNILLFIVVANRLMEIDYRQDRKVPKKNELIPATLDLFN